MLTCMHADCFCLYKQHKVGKGPGVFLLLILPDPKLSGLHLPRAGRADNNRGSLLAQGIFDIMAAADNLHLHKRNARF